MASEKPVLKVYAWVSIIPHAVVLAVLIYACRLIGLNSPVLVALIVFAVLFLYLNYTIPKLLHHGMALMKIGEYEKAIDEFRKCYDYFSKHIWMDKYRYLMLSPNRISYREMAMINIGFCYSSLNNVEKAKEMYQNILIRFPKSRVAHTALHNIQKIKTMMLSETDQETYQRASLRPLAVKQIDWIALIVNIMAFGIILLLLSMVWYLFLLLFPIGCACLVFFTRLIIGRHNRRGMRLLKRFRYEKAIEEYKAGYALFEKNLWLDRLRYKLLISFNRISFRESALLNIAYCYGQLGDSAKSIEYYQKTLEQFPDSQMAQTSLQIFDAVKNMRESS